MNKAWFQNRLKELKISQRQLAHRISLDPAAVSYMLAGPLDIAHITCVVI